MQRFYVAGLAGALALWAGFASPGRAQPGGRVGGVGVEVGVGGGVGVGGVGAGAGGGVGVGYGGVAGVSISGTPFAPPLAPGYPYQPQPSDYNMGKFFYYPFYYFPHSYWPLECPHWPERPGEHYMRAPAYMTYPPFKEPHWRYEWYQPQRYYRGFHFWLDQF